MGNGDRMTNDQGPMTREYSSSNDQSDSSGFTDSADDEFWGISTDNKVGDAFALKEDNGAGQSRVFDLEERTAKFGEAVIRFAKLIPQNPVNIRLISQLVGAGTSIGANYCEADDAVSKKDFRNKIGTCRKEAKETKYFLRMIATADEKLKPNARALWQEAKELHLIFCAILRK
jgi:four helix bundle protein